MSGEYICPTCSARISPDDVNVGTDVALCRACGKTTSFSMISGASRISPDILDRPPRHITVSKDFSDGMVIRYRKISPVAFFLIPFTAFWSGISMIGIYGTQIRDREFDLAQSLFGLPFLLGTVVLVGVILYMLLGEWRVTLRKGEGSVFVGFRSLGYTRRFDLNRDTLVSLRMSNVRVNNVLQEGISVRNGDQETMFATTIHDDSKRFIAAAVQKATGR